MDIEKQIAYKKIYINTDTKNKWSEFANKIKIHEIEGEHSTMFEIDGACEFAGILQQYLKTDVPELFIKKDIPIPIESE